jgi:2-phospho-L-lactate guanylyltransferase
MWALIPVKDFNTCKSRLANALPDYARQSLMAALLSDLVDVLKQCPAIEGISLVTRCHKAASLADKHKIEVISLATDTCLNSGITAAVGFITARQQQQTIILHGDLPMATTDDIDDLVRAHCNSGCSISLVPDNEHNGTNAILLNLPTEMVFAYGDNSYAAHSLFCSQHHLAVQTLENKHIGCDIDLWNDFKQLFTLASNTRQRHYLAHWLEQYGDLFEWPHAANL